LIGVSKGGGGRRGVVLLSTVLPLFRGADLPASASAAVRRNFSNDTVILVEYVNTPRGTPVDSLVNMLRTDDTIPRLPRAVAELTRFRTGGVSFFGERLPVWAGLSDIDFFIAGGCRALLVDSRSGLSCWFSGLVLMDPVVLELSIESLLLFYMCEE